MITAVAREGKEIYHDADLLAMPGYSSLVHPSMVLGCLKMGEERQKRRELKVCLTHRFEKENSK